MKAISYAITLAIFLLTTNISASESSDKGSRMVGFKVKGKVLSVLPAADGWVTIRVQVAGAAVIFRGEISESTAPSMGQMIMLEGSVEINKEEATDELWMPIILRWRAVG